MSSQRKREQKLEELKIIRSEKESNHEAQFCELCQRSLIHTPHHNSRLSEITRIFHKHAICKQCDQQLHLTFRKDRQRAKSYISIESTLADSDFQKYLKWVKKIPADTII
jgi:uncharacterized protein with PIN domain